MQDPWKDIREYCSAREEEYSKPAPDGLEWHRSKAVDHLGALLSDAYALLFFVDNVPDEDPTWKNSSAYQALPTYLRGE